MRSRAQVSSVRPDDGGGEKPRAPGLGLVTGLSRPGVGLLEGRRRRDEGRARQRQTQRQAEAGRRRGKLSCTRERKRNERRRTPGAARSAREPNRWSVPGPGGGTRKSRETVVVAESREYLVLLYLVE